jgi:hypothetical protein
MVESQQDATAQQNDGLAQAADRLRDSAKWLIVSFGAAAAVVVAGISLSDVGRISGDTPGYRLAFAIGGALVAIVGVLAALAWAMSLAAASTVTIDDLQARPSRWQWSLRFALAKVQEDPALSPWGNELRAFVEALRDARSRQKLALDRYMEEDNDEDSNRDASSDRLSSEEAQQRLDRATFLVDELEGTMGRLLVTASFLRLQESFRVARVIITLWLLLAAAGVLAFAYAVRTGPAALDVPASPVAASVSVPPDDRADLAKRLGTGCRYSLDAVPIIVLSLDEETVKAQAVTLPAMSCKPVRLEIDRDRITGSPPAING